MSVDLKKLQEFVEAATSNPKHPVYQLGLQHSAMLQSYAVNVQMIQSVPAEQWFKDYPEWTAKLAEVMRLCEEDEAELAKATAAAGATVAEVAALRKTVAALEARVAALSTAPAGAGDGGSGAGGGAARPANTAAVETETEETAGGDEDEKPFDGMEDEK